MKTNIIMVGMDHWEDFTLPAIRSIQEHEPDVRIILIDHGKKAYPKIKGVETIRLNKPHSYAAAINIGINHAKADWYFITNNDVLCTGPFVHEMSKKMIYCHKAYRSENNFWFDNCFVFISDLVWDDVGEFDEKFLVAAFEDADYSFRAQALGFSIHQKEMPFLHFEGTTRFGVPDYNDIRYDNLLYLQSKYPERNIKVPW